MPVLVYLRMDKKRYKTIFYIGSFLIVLAGIEVSAQTKKEKKIFKTFKVKSVTENVTEIINGKETTRKDSYTSFDKDANVISKEEYRKDGTLKHKETAKYDSNGNKLEETIFDAAETLLKTEKNIKHITKYDSDDNKTEEQEYDASGKMIRKQQFSYNSNGDKILEVEYDGEGKLMKRTVYMYNSKGLRIEKKEYDGANTLLSDRKYQYQF